MLQKRYQAMLKKLAGQQAKLDAAMLKADPHLAPVMAKLKVLREQHTPSAGNSSSTPPVSSAPILSAAELSELRAARNQAIKTDADWVTDSKKLAEEMRAFESEIDAAMIKADPSLGPIIAKIKMGRHSQVIAANPSHPK